MTSSPRGYCLIINIFTVAGEKQRDGTNIDRDNLKNIWTQFGFDVTVYDDLSAKDMETSIKKFAKDERHARVDACVVCILTHGSTGILLGADGANINIEKVVYSPFYEHDCPSLKGKPKIFIIQACRGIARQGDVTSVKTCETSELKQDANPLYSKLNPESSSGSLSCMADFITCYPTTEGFVSYRTNSGSWYISALVTVLAQDAHHKDFCAMLNKIQGNCYAKQTEPDARKENAVQIGEFRSYLFKAHLYFFQE